MKNTSYDPLATIKTRSLPRNIPLDLVERKCIAVIDQGLGSYEEVSNLDFAAQKLQSIGTLSGQAFVTSIYAGAKLPFSDADALYSAQLDVQ